MYSTGFTQRSGHYSNVYQKAGFESNMPSIHSAVPGTYGPNYRPSAGWGNTNSHFQGHSHVKQNSADFFDGTNGFKKSQSEYMAESCWEGTTPDQTVCYGECKRSGRMCASCVQYMQSNYGVQKMPGRCQTQMLQAHTYPQRHPSWHGANALPHRVQSSHNGYPLQRSNSEPTGYGFHDNYNSPHNHGSCHSPWGAKSQAVDITRRTSTWYQNGFHQNPSQTHGYNTDNNVPFKATSCEVANQRYKMQMRSSSATSMPMVSPERDSIMPRAQTRFSSSQWNSPVAMPSMPNTCVSMNGTPAQGNQCHHRPESLQYHHACAFPPTPPAEPHYAMATSNKVGNNSSCQLPQMVPNPTIMNSPNQPSRADTAYWNGPSSVNNPAVEGISKYQYCSQTNVVTSVGTTVSSPSRSLQSQTTVNSSVSSACPTVPSSCDLSDKAWQSGIIDINTTGCDVNDKARIFSAELEKLAKLSQNFDNDEFEFTNVSTNTTILSPSATTLSSEGVACTNVVTSIGPTEKMTCFETPKYSPRSTEFTNVGQCLSSVPETNTSSCVRGSNPTEKESQQSGDKAPELDNNVTTSTSDGQVDDLGKLKTKHTDYLDQTSDVNPYGSQNCIAALSASCRKMIADMDKPEKVPSTEQLASQKQTSPSQQNNSNVNNFIDNTNGVTNCFNGSYGPSMQHQHQHHHTHSFPVDPYTLHYAQHPMPNQHGSVDKCRRGRKRKSNVGRGSGPLNNGRQFDHSDLTKKSSNMMTQHSHHENLGKDVDQSRSPPLNNSADSDLRNISPTFSDGPVSFDILDSVFSPENSLNTSTSELSNILEGPNPNANFPLCNTFSDYETVMPSAGGSHCSSSPGVLPAPPTPLSAPAPTPSSQERHPLEILQDQIKIQRQQFSLDRPSEKLPEPNNNNTPNTDPTLEKTPVHNDVNENHVIESIQ